MICKNCGAEYEDNRLSCPYCRTENRKAVNNRKKEILNQYDKEADAMQAQAETYAERTANKLTKKIIVILGVLAVCGVVVAVFFVLAANFKVNYGYWQKNRHIQRLEEMLAEADYAGMESYLDKKKLYRGYDKYEQPAELYRYYLRMKDDGLQMQSMEMRVEWGYERWKSLTEFYVDDILKSAAEVIGDYQEYAMDKTFLGNEEALGEIYLLVVEELKLYGFTEENFSEIELKEKGTCWNEFRERIWEYYWQA